MIKELFKFFKFSGPKNEKRFITAVILEVIASIFFQARFIAVYFLCEGIAYDMNIRFGKFFLNEGVTWTRFIIICSILLVSVIGMVMIKAVSTMCQTKGGYECTCDKRVDIALKLRYVPMGFYNNNSLGYITSVATNSMEALSSIATRVVMMVLNGVVTTGVILVMMFFFNWTLALVVLGVCVVFGVISFMHQKVAKKITPRKIHADEGLISSVLEYTEGISEVKNYNMVKDINGKLNQEIIENRNVNIKMEALLSQFDIYTGIILYGGSIVLIILSIIQTLNHTMSLAMGIVMVIVSVLIFNELRITSVYSSLLKAVSATIEKVNDILNEEDMKDNGKDLTPINHDISIKDVSFSYDKKKVIDDVSFDIKENTLTAIVGPSGSGKTTICKLISRFFDVDEGNVTLGGVDVKDYSINSLMRNFSFVFQNVYLFNDTIKNNIKFGKEDATDEEVYEASRKACCDEFIRSLPEGYDTKLTDGGLNLSGGERQRISIARAMLKDAPIIILDEATANIDPENESLLTKAFNNLTKDKTVIMIAHKLNTVKEANKIIVFDNGKISQMGNHEELINQEGIYKRFIEERTSAQSWKI